MMRGRVLRMLKKPVSQLRVRHRPVLHKQTLHERFHHSTVRIAVRRLMRRDRMRPSRTRPITDTWHDIAHRGYTLLEHLYCYFL